MNPRKLINVKYLGDHSLQLTKNSSESKGKLFMTHHVKMNTNTVQSHTILLTKRASCTTRADSQEKYEAEIGTKIYTDAQSTSSAKMFHEIS